MNTINFMTVKDYLLYYIPGIIWLLDTALLFLPVNNRERLYQFLKDIKSYFGLVNAILLAALILVIPYIIGFVLNPICNGVTKLLRKICGDPKEFLVDYESDRYKGRRIRKSTIEAIIHQLKKSLGDEIYITEANIHKWFFQVRAFVIQSRGGASDLAIRAQDMANFSESLILPVPLFFIVLGYKLWNLSPLISLGLIIWGLITFYLLSYRYFKLREFWVKHVYRAFLVIKSAGIQKEDVE